VKNERKRRGGELARRCRCGRFEFQTRVVYVLSVGLLEPRAPRGRAAPRAGGSVPAARGGGEVSRRCRFDFQPKQPDARCRRGSRSLGLGHAALALDPHAAPRRSFSQVFVNSALATRVLINEPRHRKTSFSDDPCSLRQFCS